MTHDSIGLGEDGPTHQPVEHLAALRAIPNLLVFRPADAIETAECWQLALERTRRADRAGADPPEPAARCARDGGRRTSAPRGAYELSPASGEAAATHLRLRLRGRDRARGAEAAGRARHRRRASSRCPAGSCSLAQPEAYRAADHRRCAGQGRGRGGGRASAGTRVIGADGRLRRHDGLRRERALQGPLQAFRHHAPRRWPNRCCERTI